MSFLRKLPIGIQSFEKLRRDEYLYIDKTLFIWKLVQSSNPYFLSRPRRFGKSLFLSALAAYFRGQKELFKDLYLEKAEEEQAVLENRPAWQEYPVFYLDFNTGQYNTERALMSQLKLLLSRFEEVYGTNKNEEDVPQRFAGVIQRAYQQTGKQVVILVDEYDKPLLQTMGVNEALNEQYRNELKAFYSVIKTCDEYIRFAFLTGVTKFSKISIFSDLNNLRDISLEKHYAGICGITQKELETNFQPEIQVLADGQDLAYQETLTALQQWYDGYCFAPAGEGMYNPFSLLNAFAKERFGSYWFETGTPTFLVNYLKEAHYFIPDLDGQVVLTESELQTYRAIAQEPFPILFQSGYLTIKEYIKEARLYRLGFPNDEVRYGFLENLLPAYAAIPFGETGKSVWQFVEDVRKGNVNGFMERMQSLIAGVSYDNFSSKELKLREQNYQTAVYLIFKLMGQFVQTEVHCYCRTATDGGGSMQQRCFGSDETRSQNYTRMYSFGVDCVVCTADTVYLFEFKLSGNSSAEDALEQIKENAYAAQHKTDGKKIVLIGTNFSEETRTIQDWTTETLEK
ncbi:AAA family ATPase [Treponema sp.]|uniref:ATP-binding protein n=2 Tax=Treponema sp. TaxID=166 RepID=UPI003FA339A3